MIYIGNAFSLQMVQDTAVLEVEPCCADTVKSAIYKDLTNTVYCIGHADTARMAAKSLNETKTANDWIEFTEEQMFRRVNVSLKSGDVLYVLQVIGGRLPEGCTELPEGVQLQWRKVTVR